MKLPHTSLRNKLIGVFLIPMLVIVLVYGFVAYFAARQGLEDELGKRLVSIGQTMSAEMSNSIEAAQIGRLDATKHRVLARLGAELEQIQHRTGVRRIFVFDRQIHSLVDTDATIGFGQPLYAVEADRLEVRRTFDTGEATTSVLFQDDQGTFYKTGYAPIFDDGNVIAAVGVEASAGYFALLQNFASALTALGAVGVVLVILAASLFAGAIIGPVNRLVAAARRLGDGQFDQPIADNDRLDDAGADGDELAFLAASFEQMRRDILSRDRQMQLMLAGIAHEVGNPLGGMELFCGLLRQDLRQEPQSDQRRQKLAKVAKIAREIDYLANVVDDFRDFAGPSGLSVTSFSAADFVHEVHGLLVGEVGDAGCRLDVDAAAGLEVVGDRQKIRRAAINLVRNACQACDENATIVLAVRPDGPAVREVVVRDDGPGIPADRLDQIWRPFFTTKEQGSGLGLALTRQIVDQHRGQIDIETAVGGPTTIRLMFPIDPPGAGELAETSSQTPTDTSTADDSDVPEGWLG